MLFDKEELDRKRLKTKQENKEIINELAEKIIYYQEKYYNNQPEISDEAFDALWDTLRVLDIDHPIFSKIGQDNDSFFEKKNHIMPMGSLDKAADETQFDSWFESHNAEYYVVQYKLDGASLELQYTNGLLSAAVTRGNGKKGDNILINARKMKGVLRILPKPISVAIRGEVIMTHEVHSKYFSDKANCRNAANGLMKRKDGDQVQLLQVYCYDLWFDTETNSGVIAREGGTKGGSVVGVASKNSNDFLADVYNTELKKLELLKELGFQVVTYKKVFNKEEINNFRNETFATRKKLGYDIDGIVVKMPTIDKNDMITLRPTRQLAYKFPLAYAQSKILDIEWSESGHLYTPVGILEPVRIAGTIVKRANLVHPNLMKEMGIGIGAKVVVVKRGEVIPKVEAVVKVSSEIYEDYPSVCSTCGAQVENTGTRVYCPNLYCRRRLLFRIQRWCAVQEIDFWGDVLLNRLILEYKVINSIGDLYRLKIEDLIKFERIGTLLAKKLIASVQSHTKTSFANLISSLGIDGVAQVTAEKIVEAGYKDWNTLKKTKLEELAEISDIGPIIAKNIVDATKILDAEVLDLLQLITIVQEFKPQSHILEKISFCFTGALAMPRKDAQNLVRRHGGTVKTSVVKDLTYLVIDNKNETNSTKLQKARKLNIKIIDENEFVKMIPD